MFSRDKLLHHSYMFFLFKLILHLSVVHCIRSKSISLSLEFQIWTYQLLFGSKL